MRLLKEYRDDLVNSSYCWTVVSVLQNAISELMKLNQALQTWILHHRSSEEHLTRLLLSIFSIAQTSANSQQPDIVHHRCFFNSTRSSTAGRILQSSDWKGATGESRGYEPPRQVGIRGSTSDTFLLYVSYLRKCCLVYTVFTKFFKNYTL